MRVARRVCVPKITCGPFIAIDRARKSKIGNFYFPVFSHLFRDYYYYGNATSILPKCSLNWGRNGIYSFHGGIPSHSQLSGEPRLQNHLRVVAHFIFSFQVMGFGSSCRYFHSWPLCCEQQLKLSTHPSISSRIIASGCMVCAWYCNVRRRRERNNLYEARVIDLAGGIRADQIVFYLKFIASRSRSFCCTDSNISLMATSFPRNVPWNTTAETPLPSSLSFVYFTSSIATTSWVVSCESLRWF